jgi:hypothetical protein
MNRCFVGRRSFPLVLSFFFAQAVAQIAVAQLAGTFHSALGTMATYEYQGDGFQSVLLPVDVTMRFSGEPIPLLTATIHAPIIGDTPSFNYPIVGEFPMIVTGTSTDGRTFQGDLLGTQYLFDWEIDPAAGGELVWNGEVGWAGGRFELTTITDAPLIPGIAGDYNQNGTVDTADYVVWRDTLGNTGGGLAADGNRDEIIDTGDYDVWKTRFGRTATAVMSPPDAAPEPSTFWIAVAICCHALMLRFPKRPVPDVGSSRNFV